MPKLSLDFFISGLEDDHSPTSIAYPHICFNNVYKMLQEKRFDFLEAKAVLLIRLVMEVHQVHSQGP